MQAKPILDLIARHESESAAKAQGVASGYDVVVWQAFRVYPPAKPLTSMTVAEVLEWQGKAITFYRQFMHSRTGYSAAGRYQIVRATLQSIIDNDWKMTDLFDESTQDLCAMALLRRRCAYDAWLGGRRTHEQFADALSMVWASLPYRTGRSYYDGDKHGNRALVSREEVLRVLRGVRGDS